MKRYRLELARDGRQWCEIVIEGLSGDDILEDVLRRFPDGDGFRATVWEEKEAARVVEFGERARTIGVRYSSVRVS